MSVKVPHGSTQYQSHQRCKCDFCDSRRRVEIKKDGVKSVIGRSHGPGVPPSFELDDPEHHVNQTELNAKMGRTGLPNGDKYTVATGSTRGLHGLHGLHASGASAPKSINQKETDAMEDLDRLERLLILEHKARAKASADAEKLALLQSTGKGPRPQPFDTTANASATLAGMAEEGLVTVEQEKERPGAARFDATSPPPHCDASHLLQHTMDRVREVTSDPANKENAAALHSFLQRQGVSGVAPPQEKTFSEKSVTEDVDTSRIRRLWNYGPRPEGAGVVWRKVKPCMPEDFSTGGGGLGNMDNRDMWKKTLLKSASALKMTATKTTGVGPAAVSEASEALPARVSVFSSERKQQEKHEQGENKADAPQKI